jgi:hypothetical protein
VLKVELDAWPMLLTTVSGVLADADVGALMAGNAAAIARGGRFISLVDITELNAVPTALQRKTYAGWRNAHFEELRRHVVAVAFVVGDRPLLRGGLTALSWLAPHPSPEGFFAGREEAVDWLHKRLDADGTPRSTPWRPSVRPTSRAPGARRER